MASFLGLLADGKDGAEAVAGGHGLLQVAVAAGPGRWRARQGRQVAVAAGPGRRRARQGRQVAMAAGPGRWRARQGRLPRYWPLGGLCGSRCVAL